MPFSVSWHTLLEHLDELPADATLITPLSHSHIHITDIQEHRIIVQFDESSEKRTLQRDQFESLYHQIQIAHDGFDLDRLPPDADPYPAVLSAHPRFEIDEDAGVIAETDRPTTTQLADTAHEPDTDDDRTEPDGGCLLGWPILIDALERHDVTDLPDLETATLVNLYTLLSDVQRDANDFRQEVADVFSPDSITTVPLLVSTAQSSARVAATARSKTTRTSSRCSRQKGSTASGS